MNRVRRRDGRLPALDMGPAQTTDAMYAAVDEGAATGDATYATVAYDTNTATSTVGDNSASPDYLQPSNPAKPDFLHPNDSASPDYLQPNCTQPHVYAAGNTYSELPDTENMYSSVDTPPVTPLINPAEAAGAGADNDNAYESYNNTGTGGARAAELQGDLPACQLHAVLFASAPCPPRALLLSFSTSPPPNLHQHAQLHAHILPTPRAHMCICMCTMNSITTSAPCVHACAWCMHSRLIVCVAFEPRLELESGGSFYSTIPERSKITPISMANSDLQDSSSYPTTSAEPSAPLWGSSPLHASVELGNDISMETTTA